MKIDPDRLRTLRRQKGLSRLQLAQRAKISERTIQRLENEPQRSQKTQEHTLNSLARALGVKEELGVLTGELPLPESDKTPSDNLDRVQIGAQVAPKTRLIYDLIKRRYGVSATEIINMAPLFFALLAESSLARRREKLKEADERIARLDQMDNETGHCMFGVSTILAWEAFSLEQESISKADLFGDHFFEDDSCTIKMFFTDNQPFDFSKENPFAHYLRKLADELAISGIVDVDGGDLNVASNFKFPHYDICRDELDRIANGSHDAKKALETGFARLSEIPQERMAKDAGEERAKWLEEKLPDILKKIPGEKKGNILADVLAMSPKGDEMKEALEKFDSQKTNSETEKGENDE